MESILPSEVARLVYGYLSSEGCKAAAQHFLEVSPHLRECQKLVKDGRKFNTRFHGRNLMQLLDLFTNIYSIVQDEVERMGQSSRTVSGEGIVMQLFQLLEPNHSFSKSYNYNTNITDPLQDESSDKPRQGAAVRRRLAEPGSSSQGRSRSSSPGTSRRPKKDDNSPPDDTVDFVLLNLLDNTELHEKIAEKINKVIATPEKESSAGTDVIKTIVKETEEDPWIQGLISEIISASAENEDGDTTTADNTEIDFRESLELQKNTNESAVEKEKTPVPIKHRLRSAKARPKVNNYELDESVPSNDNHLSNVKNGKSKKQSDNNIDDNSRESHINETESTQPAKKTCMLEAALSNCDINQSLETSPQTKDMANDKDRIEGISSLKNRSETSDTNFCFVDVNEASRSSCVSPAPVTAACGNQPVDTTNMIVLPNTNLTQNTTTTNLPSNSQIIFTPRNQNSTLMTLPSPLFGSGSIFTVIPPTATSTPAPNKHFSAVVVSEDPLKVPNNNIYTEKDVVMAIPVTTTPLMWDYVPITPKPEVPDSEATKKTKSELLEACRSRGQNWRKGLKGNIRKTIGVPTKGGIRPIIPKRPPVRTLKNVPRQKLVNGVEIEVLDGVTFNESSSNMGLPTIIEFVNEDLSTAENNAGTNGDEDQHKRDNEQNEDQAECNTNLDEQNCAVRENEFEENTSPLVGASSPHDRDQLETKPIIQTENELLVTNAAKVNANIKGTPGPLPRKKLSLSTPRRRSSHIRALDFNTPPKRFLGRRSNTSPKKVLSPRKSILNNVKRAKLFKSPNSSAQSNEKELVFKSPISKDPLPIATLSPANMSLRGDWDKVNGVQMIISSETEIDGRRSKKQYWDEDLRSLITDEYKDPSPPKKSTTKKKQSPKKTTRRKNLRKKGNKSKKINEEIKLENINANNVEGNKAEKGNITENDGSKTSEFSEKNNALTNIEVEVHSSEKNEIASNSKLSTVDSVEPNVKPTSQNSSDGSEKIDRGLENSKNTDNNGLLMVVEEEEETNVLDSSTMSESVLGLRIEESLRKVVGDEDNVSKNKNNDNSSSDLLNVLMDQNTKKTDSSQIEIRIESAEDCETAKVHSLSVTNVSVGTNLKVDTDFAIPVALLSNDILNKPHGDLPILETPVKLDFAGLVPRTPYLDTPMLKTIRESTSILSRDLLLTPSLPATPFQDGASNSYSNLSDKTPNKGNLEDVLIQECKRMEVEKTANQNNNKSSNIKQEHEENGNDKVEAKESQNLDKLKSKSVKKSPAKITKEPVLPNKKSKGGKSKTKPLSQDSKSSVKRKKKKKSSDQLIEAYLKQAKEELFGDDVTSSSDEDIFEKKDSKKKNTPNSTYSMVYTDESSTDRMKRKSKNNTPSKAKISPAKFKGKNKTKLIVNDSNDSLDNKRQRMVNKMKGIVSPKSVSPKKTSSSIGISFNTNVTVPTSMEELVQQSQSPQKFCSSPMPEKLSASSSNFVRHKLPSLFTPPKLSNSTRTVDSINLRWHSPVISPCPKKTEHINTLVDEIARRKSNENNKDFPSLYLSPDSSESGDENKPSVADHRSEETQNAEVRNFPIDNRSEILKHQKSVDPDSINEANKHKLQAVNKEPTISSQVKQPISNRSTVFLSKNETFTTIIFDEINFVPKPVVKIDDFDNYQVDIVVNVDEGGRDLYSTLSIQPLQVLMDIDPKPFSLSNKELNSSKPREHCSQNPNSENLSLRKHEEVVKNSSSNRSDLIDIAPKPVNSSCIKALNSKPKENCVQNQSPENQFLRKNQETVRDMSPNRRHSTDAAPKTHQAYHASSSKECKLSKTRKISENISFRKHDRVRDTSTNRSDRHSPISSTSRNRESRDRSVTRWVDTTSRKMEYTRRSDGKRRIKPIRIDDHEYEARLNRREYEQSRHERYNDKSRSSSRHNRDKSRTKREEDRTHHSDSSRDYKRNNSYDKKRSESGTKYYMRSDQKIEEEDRRQKCESENELKQLRERTLISYEDKEDAISLTEDDLMNMAVTSGPSLTSSKRTEKRRSSHETENSPRKLPLKKRKASSDENFSDVPVKKPKSDGPQALLKKVDLDHFLSVVHGENSTASPT